MKYRLNTCFFLVLFFGMAGFIFSQTHYKDLKYPELGNVEMPEPEIVKLENGMTVVLVEDHEFPFIKMRAEYIAGAVWGEPDDKTGLARITGDVMRSGGFESMTGDEIDEKLESLAASVETWISDVYGGASVNTIKDHFDVVADIFAGVMKTPAFPQDKLDLAKIEAKSVISRRNDDPGDIADREFNRLIYKNSKFDRLEEYATIDDISRENLVAFHKKWVRPNGMVLGVWGDFDKKVMIQKIKDLFEDWEPAGSSELRKPDVPYDWSGSLNLIEKNDVNQSNILIGHLGGTKDCPDYAALILMNQILGGGLSSRMFTRIRSDSGFAYAVGANYGTNFFHPGTFTMTCLTKSERTVAAIRAMLREMRLMTEQSVTEKELKVAKEGWLNSYVFNFDSMDEIVRRLVQYSYNGYPLDFLQKTRAGIEKVTKEDILNAAKNYLHPDKVHILVVGKPEDFDQPLSVLGTVNKIDISIPEPKKQIQPATADDLAQGKKLFTEMMKKLGGMEKMAAVKNVTFDFEMSQVTPMGEMNMDAKRTVVYPDFIYMEMNTPQGDVEIISNGEETWLQVPQGPMDAPEYIVKQLKTGMKTDLTMLCRSFDRIKVQYAGETTFGEKKARELLVTFDDFTFSFFIDDQNIPLGKRFDSYTPQGPVTADEFWQELKNVDGILQLFKLETLIDGEVASKVNIRTIVFNTDVDMNLFVK
ncbi:insulinase family protein [candidate division KSB1 bacterium]|nr:insulinase family protein [candidate division KSB1 bacterium]